MRSVFLIVHLISLFAISSYSQTKKVEAVKNWGAVFIPSGNYFWSAAEKQLIQVMDKQKLAEVKTFSVLCNWPYGLFEIDDLLDDEYEEWEVQMSKLNFETIAAIRVGAANYYLLELPYQKNLNWDKRYFWKKSLYFFFQDKYLKLSN